MCRGTTYVNTESLSGDPLAITASRSLGRQSMFLLTLVGLLFTFATSAVDAATPGNDNFADAQIFAGLTTSTTGAKSVGSDSSGINAQLASATTGSISGTVTGPSSNPLAGICVNAFDSGGNIASLGSTDASGNYTLSGLSGLGLTPGDYRLQFSDCSFNNVLSEYYNDKSTLAAADPISVTAGSDTSGINAQLASAAPGSISGTVIGPSSSPLQNICVSALNSYGNPAGLDITDASGNYTLSGLGLTPGDYRIHFLVCSSNNVLSEYYNDKPSFESADPVAVTGGSVTSGINAQLATGGSISGTVTNSSAVPLGGICVAAYDPSNFEYPVTDDITDASGNYSVDRLTTGDYLLRFSDCGSNNVLSEYYNDKASLDSADPVAVIGGSVTSGINAQLAPDGTPTQHTLTAAKSGTGQGTVTSNPAGIDCGATCSHVYADGTSVTLTASPTAGSNFTGWSGAGCSGTGSCQVTIASDQSATATFAADVVVPKAKVSNVKVSGPRKIKKGKKATYKAKITNSGNATATGVRLKVSGRGLSFNTSVGKIAAKKTRTVKVKIKPKKPGKVKASFKVTSKNAGGKTVKRNITVNK